MSLSDRSKPLFLSTSLGDLDPDDDNALRNSNSSDTVTTKLLPSTSCISVQSMLSYVLFYCGNVLTVDELLMMHLLTSMATTPTTTTTGTTTSRSYQTSPAGRGREEEEVQGRIAKQIQRAEICYRLLTRKPPYFPISQLQTTYGGDSVDDAVHYCCNITIANTLAAEQEVEVSPPAPCTSACVLVGNSGNDIRLMRLVGGADIADWIARGFRDDASIALRCVNTRDLRDILTSIARRCGKKILFSSSSSSTTTAAADDDQSLMVSPRRKDGVIDSIINLAAKGNCEPLRQAWDETVGDMCCVNKRVKTCLELVSALFYILTDLGTSDFSSSSSSSSSSSPLPTSSAAILSTLGITHFPLRGVLPDFIAGSGNSGAATTLQLPLHPLRIFSSRDELDLFLKALQLKMELFDATQGAGRFMTFFRGKGTEQQQQQKEKWERTVRDWHKRARELLKTTTTAADVKHSSRHRRGQKRGRQESFEEVESSGWGENADDEHHHHQHHIPSVRDLLSRRGTDAVHLLRFLPVYQVYSCLALIAEHLETLKDHGAALSIYIHLLDVPVHQLFITPTTSYNFWFRPQKRGFFWTRRLLCLSHLGHEKEVLDLAEVVLAASFVGDLGSQTAPSAQAERFARLVISSPGWQKEDALRFYYGEIAHRNFLRRADRLSVERILMKWHKPPRRWCPLPSHLIANSLLRNEHHVFLHAKRLDVTGRTLWRGAEGDRAEPLFVEDYVLQWYIGGRGRKEKGWRGQHCEGRWISLLFHLCFYDALFCPAGASGLLLDDFTWLSPFQHAPMDLTVPQHFAERRKAELESILAKLEHFSREEFVKYVMSRAVLGQEEEKSKEEEDSLVQSDGSDLETANENDHDDDDDDVQQIAAVADDDAVNAENNKKTTVDDPTAATRPKQQQAAGGVSVGSFPIFELALGIPIRELCALFRIILFSPPADGFTIRFSGFPDLVLWQREEGPSPPAAAVAVASPNRFLPFDPNPVTWPVIQQFRVCEVKSPSDSLSDKQIVVMDVLQRVGFQVDVAQIIDTSTSAAPTSSLRRQATAPPTARENASKKIIPRNKGVGSVLLPICPE